MNLDEFTNIINQAKDIVLIQADNPDGDSLASSLAMEELLETQGKNISMYCGVEIPNYLRYMPGWDRIVHELPNKFDASIILDTSAVSLLESLQKQGSLSRLKTKPCIIIDHHQTEATIDFATLSINEETVSTGEIIFKISKQLNWKLTESASSYIAFSILSDSLGLTSEAVKADTLYALGELIENGVSMAKLDDMRRSLNKKSRRIVTYKGQLMQRIEYHDDPRVATITIPWLEIEKFSHEYNPSMLVIDEMRMTEGVQVAIAFKTYPDGKITAKIRTNIGYKVASQIAEYFGGGGHVYAAGFKINKKRDFLELKKECVDKATEFLDQLGEDHPDETVQHTF